MDYRSFSLKKKTIFCQKRQIDKPALLSYHVRTMAHKKAQGAAKNLNDSNPQYLGTKLYDGQKAIPGAIIVRQRGTKILPGTNVGLGKDHTLYALKEGLVKFTNKRKLNFDGTHTVRKAANIVEAK
jgi:large subunit ribosomal protein L27